MPPTEPEPDALDQMTSGSSGSGVAQPLSPPATECHSPRGMGPGPAGSPPPPPPNAASFKLAGPRDAGPSCQVPMKQEGIRASTVTWHIYAIGSHAGYDVPASVVIIAALAMYPTVI